MKLKPDKDISPYAAAARQTDYSNLPPAYTLWAMENLFIRRHLRLLITCKKAAFLQKSMSYPTDMHAFDMMDPESEPSRQAAKKFNEKIDWENLK